MAGPEGRMRFAFREPTGNGNCGRNIVRASCDFSDFLRQDGTVMGGGAAGTGADPASGGEVSDDSAAGRGGGSKLRLADDGVGPLF